jgi:ribosomal protein S27AE
MGFPGDSDPRDEELQPECPKCSDLLVVDNYDEWVCLTCILAEGQKKLEQQTTNEH